VLQSGVESAQTLQVIQTVLWFLAGGIALYFSLGNSRIWTSISTGFFLLFISQAYLLYPAITNPRLTAIHFIVGTIAIMVMTFGFQEYYVFSRTLESGGSKVMVYLITAIAIGASLMFLLINPEPSPAVVRQIKLIENVNWVFLAMINIDMAMKIHAQIHKGFLAFVVCFGLIFLWRGSELYLQVFGWDQDFVKLAGKAAVNMPVDTIRIPLSRAVHEIAGLASSVAVGGTFLFLVKRLR
jgi:hypothetical protein